MSSLRTLSSSPQQLAKDLAADAAEAVDAELHRRVRVSGPTIVSSGHSESDTRRPEQRKPPERSERTWPARRRARCTSGACPQRHTQPAQQPAQDAIARSQKGRRSAPSDLRIPWKEPRCSEALLFAHPADVVPHKERGAMVPDEQARSPAEDRHHFRAALRRLLPNLRGETEQQSTQTPTTPSRSQA